jgi:hypothetical protein
MTGCIPIFYGDSRYRINPRDHIAPLWHNRLGTVLRWVFDQAYIVLVDNDGLPGVGTELVLIADRGEISKED